MGMHQPLILSNPLPTQQETPDTIGVEELLTPHPLTHPSRVTVTGFSAGTLIETPSGLRRVQSLEPGDMVDTIDDGPRPLNRVGVRSFRTPRRMAPVVIRPNTMRNANTLKVSPGTLILIQEEFVAAKDLVNCSTILREPGLPVTYHYLQFHRSHIITAGGVECGVGGPSALSLLDQEISQTDRMTLV